MGKRRAYMDKRPAKGIHLRWETFPVLVGHLPQDDSCQLSHWWALSLIQQDSAELSTHTYTKHP